VRGLLAASSKKRSIWGNIGFRQQEAYECHLDGVADSVYIIGPYMNNIGGCDRIRPYDTILHLLDKYAARGHVVFEGVLISDNFGQVGEWLENKGKKALVVFLDTPLEVCLSNIAGRTEDAGTKHVERKFIEIQKVKGWFIENDKVRVMDVSMKDGLEKVMGALRGG